MVMSKYNEQTVQEIRRQLEEGMLQKDAARLAGITEETFYNWQREKKADGIPNPEYHPEFSELVERAITVYKQKLIKVVNFNSLKDGRLALEVLARRWPDEYGAKIEVGGTVEHKLTYDQALVLLDEKLNPKPAGEPDKGKEQPSGVHEAGVESKPILLPAGDTSSGSPKQ